MSESTALEGAAQARDEGSPTPAAVTSAGALLRQGRVAAGLHIAALAVALKVPVRRLEALESDRFDLLPDAVFVRALASSVCRALKMDAAPVLALLPASVPPRLSESSAHTHDAYHSGGSARGLPMWRMLPKPVMVSAAVLVLATAGLIFWPLVQKALATSGETSLVDSASASGTLTSTEVLRPAIDAPVVPAVVMADPSAPPASAALAAAPAPGAAVLPFAPAVAAPAAVSAVAAPTAAMPPSPALSTSAAQAVSAAPPASGIIVFRPSAESWVEVTDAKGTVLLRRMLAAGESAGASGALPMSAVVGRADVTQVLVRGQAFDLKTIARENVARFEVK